MITWIVAAWAQQAAEVAGAPVLGDAWRPSVDMRGPVLVDDTDRQDRLDAGLVLAWGHHPLVEEGGEVVLSDVGWAAFSVAWQVGPVRIGGVVPVGLAVGDGWTGARLRPGDLVVDVRVTALPAIDRRPGVAFVGRAFAPMGGADSHLGVQSGGGELGVISDLWVDRAWMGVEAGWRGVPRADVGDLLWDDALWWRAGLGLRVGKGALLALEGAGSIVPRAPAMRTSPTELLVSAGLPLARHGRFRVGVGGSPWRAWGASTFRVTIGLGDALPVPTPGDAQPER